MSDVLDQLREAETASDQLKILQLAWGSGGAGGMVELSLDEAQAILDKLATGKSKAQQIELINRARAERAVVSAFDVALSALIAPMHLVRHIEKVIVTAGVNGVCPSRISSLLDQLEERCFISAAQASTILSAVPFSSSKDSRLNGGSSRRFEYYHVVCARVLDRWNLNETDHTEVACYYGWSPSYLVRLFRQAMEADAAHTAPAALVQTRVLEEQSADQQGSPPLYSRLLQNRVLAHMGRADHGEYARSWAVRDYASRIIARNLSAGASGQVAEDCAVCLEPCHDGTPLWTCLKCRNKLHASCRRGWEQKRKRVASDDDDEQDDETTEHNSDDGRGVPCPYCRSVCG